MTVIQAQVIGDSALLPRTDLDRLLEIARRSEAIDLQINEEDLPTMGMMRLSEIGGSFEFWQEPGEDVYALQDGEAVR